MYPTIGYGRLLLLHFIIGLISFVINGLIFAVPLISMVKKLYEIIVDNSLSSDDLFALLIEISISSLLIVFGSLIISKFITAGLSYIPYLHKTNNLSIKSILLIGFQKAPGIILINVIILFVVLIITTILSFIPIVSIVLSFGVSYVMGLIYFWLDYHLSRNQLHGQKMFAHLSFNYQQFFKRTPREREVYILPLYFMAASLLSLGKLFIFPLFQLRIIRILEDEEQAFLTPPPPINSYPPNQIY